VSGNKIMSVKIITSAIALEMAINTATLLLIFAKYTPSAKLGGICKSTILVKRLLVEEDERRGLDGTVGRKCYVIGVAFEVVW
jgi:hypothetical protein